MKVEVRRGRLVESSHKVLVAVTKGGRRILTSGDSSTRVFLRSALKPIQAQAVLSTGVSVDPRQIAIMCGSHDGEPEQVQAVLSILSAAGLGSDALRCPPHWPTSKKAAATLKEPTPLHNPCSGKHAGMLAACIHRGWPIANYPAREHPLQRLNRRTLADFTSSQKMISGIDGCGVPTYAVSLYQIASAFEKIPQRIYRAMLTHPELVGRPCSTIMRVAGDLLVCKFGGEGICGAMLPADGVGIVIKSVDGALRPLLPVLVTVLTKLGFLRGGARQALDLLQKNNQRTADGKVASRIVVRV